MRCLNPFRLLLLIPYLFACLCTVGSGEDRGVETDRAAQADGAHLRLMIRQLAATDFSLRLAAEHELQLQGLKAIPFLQEASASHDPELSVRAVETLVRLYLTAESTVSEQADSVLEDVAVQATNPGSTHAKSALSRIQSVRKVRAIAELRRLGAKVDMAPDRNRIAMDFVLLNDRNMELFDLYSLVNNALNTAEIQPEARQNIPQMVGNVFFTDRWTGGEEGLRHLQRLGPLEDPFPGQKGVQVYVTSDAPISMDSVKYAAAFLGVSEVQERGPSLGVTGTEFQACYVTGVLPGGAADQAGFHQNDLILGALSLPRVDRSVTAPPIDPAEETAGKPVIANPPQANAPQGQSPQKSTEPMPMETGEVPVPKAPPAQDAGNVPDDGKMPIHIRRAPGIPVDEEETQDKRIEALLPGGRLIGSFNDLVNFCREQKSGQPVRFLVARYVTTYDSDNNRESTRMEHIVLEAKLSDWNEIDTESGLWRESAWSAPRQIQVIPFPGGPQPRGVIPVPLLPRQAFPPKENDPFPPPNQADPFDNDPLPELK